MTGASPRASSAAAPRGLARWAAAAHARAPWVLLAALVLTGAAGLAVVRHLGVQTSTDALLSPELPARLSQQRVAAAFPQREDLLVLVVDADTPERARDLGRALAAALRRHPERFRDVDVPFADPFLEAHALYYLDPDEIQDLQDRLVAVQPFLGRLVRDGSLRGLLDMLDALYAAKVDDGEDLDASRLVDAVAAAMEGALSGRARPMSWELLLRDEADVGPEDRRQLVLARAVREEGTLFPVGASLSTARRLFADLLAASPGSGRMRITGSVAMEHEEFEDVQRGFAWISLLTLALVAAVLLLGLRSVRLVVASVITVVVGLVWTAGFAAVTVGHLNMISIAFGILYIGLGVDYAIHLGLRWLAARADGEDEGAAVATAVTDVGGSLVLCSLTTAIGFYAFVPTDFVGVSELGIISGTGMFVSLAAALSVLPALLAVLPGRRVPAPPRPGRLARLLDLPLRHRKAVLVGAAVLVLGAAGRLPPRFDPNPIDLRDPDAESVATFRDLLATSRTPPWSVTVLASDAAAVPARVAALESVDRVGTVVTLDAFVPDRQAEKALLLEDLDLAVGAGLAPAAPATPPTAAERRAGLEALGGTLDRWLATRRGGEDVSARRLRDAVGALLAATGGAPGSGLLADVEHALLVHLDGVLERLRAAIVAAPFTAGDLPAALVARWATPAGLHRVEAFPADDLDDDGALRRFAEAVQQVAPDATGAPVLIVEAGDAIAGAFREALLLSLAGSALVLLIALRRVGDVLLVLLPLGVAAVLTGAAMVAVGMPFNFENVIAIPLLLGIGVDSGIHVVHRARGRLPDRADGNPLRTSTARAVLFSALTTLCSFGVLALSPHPGTASLGLLLTFGIGTTLLGTLVLLPALLARG